MRCFFDHMMPVFVLFVLSSCASLRVSEDVQNGRKALMLGQPEKALSHFSAAAAQKPNYSTRFTLLNTGIWTYVGRAYYEMGENEKALDSLERAKDSFSDDYFARIYLGLVLSQSGRRRKGMTELEAGLKGLGIWLESLPYETPRGQIWDPSGKLKGAIAETRALIRQDNINLTRVDEYVRWLGERFEEEIEAVKGDVDSSTGECNEMSA